MEEETVFCPDRPDTFEKWVTAFQYRIHVKIAEVNFLRSKEDQIDVNSEQGGNYLYARFMEEIGSNGRKFIEAQVLSNLAEKDQKDYLKIVTYLVKNCQPKQNTIKIYGDFIKCSQNDEETLTQFINRVRQLASSVNTEDKEHMDKLTLTVLLYGLRDKKACERILLMEKIPSLESAVQMLKAHEAVEQGSQNMTENNVDKVDRRYKNEPAYKNRKEGDYKGSQCGRCGSTHGKRCPAWGSRCTKCSRIGHYAKCCKTKNNQRYENKRNVNPVERESYENNSEEGYYDCYGYNDADDNTNLSEKTYMGEVTINAIGTASQVWLLEANVGNASYRAVNTTPVKFKIDTGAAVNCLPYSIYKGKQWGQLQPPGIQLLGAAETKLATKGVITLSLSYRSKVITDKFYVIDNLKTPLLGLTGINKLEIVKRIGEISTPKQGEKAKWIKKFPKLFHGLGTMNRTYKIKLDNNAEPISVSTPRRVPLPLMDSVKSELKKLEDQGIIEPISKPTKYCSPLVVVPKPGGRVRICGDFVHLNKDILRERFELPTVDDTLSKLSNATVFSKLDANSGFYQIKLDPKSSELTTFITPFGRYKYKRLPMGISSAPEVYMREMHQILEGMPGVACLMDDVAVVGKTKEEHDLRLKQVMTKLQNEGVTLNADKCLFGCSSMKYLGHIVDSEGIRADPEKIKAVTELRRPENVSGVRQFLGMVNQLTKFVPNIAEKTKPIRELLHKDNKFVWGEIQEEAFKNLKTILTSTQVLAHYDNNKRTVLAVDACNSGLGGCLYQESEGKLKPVAYASKSLSDTESRYAIIEKEALAVTWGCERFSQYLIGRQFEIQTDHRPLVASLQTKRLDSLSPRLQRFKMRLSRYDYWITYVPGKQQSVPDAFSRSPIDSVETFMEADIQDYNIFTVQSMPISPTQLEKVVNEQHKDPVLSKLIVFFTNNKGREPSKNEFPLELREFMSFYHEINMVENILLRGQRIIIPSSMRKEMLHRIHQGHQGITKCQRLARNALWWPRVNQEIENMVNNCEACSKNQVPRAEPMIGTKTPEYPWQKIGADFFEWNNTTYLLLVDYLSRWIEIAKMTSTSGTKTVEHFKSLCARFGIPEEIRTDNGPQFVSHEFAQFCSQYEIKHTTSTPRYPQSNGESERAVKTVKNMLKKCADSNEDPHLAMLNYRTSPLESGLSPAEVMMGRKLRTQIPRPTTQLVKRIPNIRNFREKDMEMKLKIKTNYDKRKGVKEKREIEPRAQVYLPQDKMKGEIIAKRGEPRSYDIRTPSGTLRRNTSQFNPIPFRRAFPTEETPTLNSPPRNRWTRLRNEIRSHLKPGPTEEIQPGTSPALNQPLDQPRRISTRSTKGVPPDRFSAGDPTH